MVPVLQDDGPDPICAIYYSPQFSETMNYFRAIVQKDERSKRALDLTAEAIDLNGANYTVWYFRRLVVDALPDYDLRTELEFVTKIGRANPKNYQVWQHRKVIVEKSKEVSAELAFTAEMIDEDSGKNYHAWAHRQWVIETFGLWDNELSYIDDMLKLDLRNNSAWNQRYFMISKWKKLSREVIAEEIQYAFKFISKAPNNQSPWAYLKGLLLNRSFSEFPELKETCLTMKEKFVSCSHVHSLLADIYEQENTPESKAKAKEHFLALANNLDTMRQKYWLYRAEKINL